jgi:predicted phosphodiesterase
MRYGVLADIHGNVQALEAVTAELGRIGVDRYLCAGDLVGYGAQPNECVEMVARLEPICVAGNHDLMALGELSEERCVRLARRSMRWTREALSDDARAYLASLPRRAEGAGGVVVAHGSLDDPEEYVLRVNQATVQLGRLAHEHPGAKVLVVGHTHLAFASDGSSTSLDPAPETWKTSLEPAPASAVALNGSRAWLLNPGAVGQSRERLALARFMLLDLERGEATFHAIPYDIEGGRRMLRRRGLPTRSYHLRPTRWKAWSRPLRRLLSRARRIAR